MEAASIKLDTRESLMYPGRQEAIIIPLSDIQLDPVRRGQPRRAHIRRLRDTLEWGVYHGAYFFGVGDYVDVASPSNRAALKSTRMYDTLKDTLEEKAEETLLELQEILAPTRGRWLGLLEGHHLWEFEDGSTTDTRLADFLGCRFLGTSGYVFARLTPLSPKHRQPTFKLWGWHGEGGGATAAAPLNKLEKKVGEHNADVYVMGHYHRRGAIPKARLDIIGGERGGDPEVVHKDIWLVSSGSFMRGYLQGSRMEGRPQGSYPEQRGLPPAGLGAMAIYARPRPQGDGYVSVDLDVSSI